MLGLHDCLVRGGVCDFVVFVSLLFVVVVSA